MERELLVPYLRQSFHPLFFQRVFTLVPFISSWDLQVCHQVKPPNGHASLWAAVLGDLLTGQKIIPLSIGYNIVRADGIFLRSYWFQFLVSVVAVKAKADDAHLVINGPLNQQQVLSQPVPICKDGLPDRTNAFGSLFIKLGGKMFLDFFNQMICGPGIQRS